MATFPAYTDVVDFLDNASTSIETNSLIGGNATLNAAIAAGVASFAVTLQPNSGAFPASPTVFQGWLLDGLNSETVTCTYSSGTVTLSGGTVTAAAHGAGASFSSAGTSGCLASILTTASRKADAYCNQGPLGAVDRSLFAVSRSETYSMGTRRAHVTPDQTLEVMPYHFPIQNLTSATLQLDAVPAFSVNLTAYTFPEGARRVDIPSVSFTGVAQNPWAAINPSLRQVNSWLTLVYTGGPIVGTTTAAIPYDIRQAIWWYTLHILAYRFNPVGAASIHQGDTSRDFRLRGDTSGKSLLEIDAESLLYPYAVARAGGGSGRH